MGHERGWKGSPGLISRDEGTYTLFCAHSKGFRGEGWGCCRVSGISGSSVDHRQQEVGAGVGSLLLPLRALGLEARPQAMGCLSVKPGDGG